MTTDMAGGNGIPDFTHKLLPFKLEGHEFQRRKIPAKEWAETLARVANSERTEMAKKQGSVLFSVSASGLYELIRLGVQEDDHAKFDQLWSDGLIEFGELTALRDWLWEQMTERPFISDTPSSDGPGSSSEVSSKDESSSPVVAPTG